MNSLLLAAALLAGHGQASNLKYRWVYVQTNLQVKENVDKLKELMARAKKDGYNGIVLADSKLERLATVPDWYFTNAAEVQKTAKDLGLEIIPCVFGVGYAAGMLSNDVNLAESMPVRGAEFVVKGGQAQLVPDPAAVFKNGGFEESQGDKFPGMGFQDSIGTSTFADHGVHHSGSTSLRMTNPIVGAPGAGNCRVMQEIAVKPHRQYHLSAWIKTENFDSNGDVWMRTLDPNGKSLSDQSLGVKRTQDWTRHDVVFNSGENTKVLAYVGVWGGKNGNLWLDDVTFEEVGLLNVVRRPACPVTVKGEDGTAYQEGKDYEPIVDPKMGNVPWPGGYEVYHESPAIKLTPATRIKEGQHLRVDFNHAVMTSDGQVAICLSDPKTYTLMADQAKRVEALFHPKGFFMSHDEIRVGNWCDLCQSRNLTAGQILAENVRKSVDMIESAHKGAETYVWSDMFDPNHNAVDNYYLTRGTLANSWLGLPKRTVVVNWYFGKRKTSLPFFSKLGYSQVLAGYYDADPKDIRTWLDDAKGLQGINGVMYTTWQGNYSGLEQFAKYAWGQ